MATFTDNFALIKPTYGELADVAVINGNMDTVDGIMHSNRTMLAPAFSQTEDYAVGDVVVHEGNLYRFIVPHTAGNWDGTEVEQTTLGEEVSTKGGADVTKTASGNPIAFDDGADAPLVKCVTEIQGSQDLHGYDKPWVGGSGKNKLPLVLDDIKALNTSGTWSGDDYTVSGVTFAVNTDGDGNITSIKATGTPTYNAIFHFLYGTFSTSQNMILNGCPSGGGESTYQIDVTGGSTYYQDSGSGVSIPSGLENKTVRIRISGDNGSLGNGITFYPMLRLSTESDPTFAPYSNICPITAYTEGKIEVRGKNLIKQIVKGYINTNNTIRIDNDSETVLIKVEQGEAYTFSSGVTTNRNMIGYVGVDELVNGTPVTNIQTLSSYTWRAEWSGWTAWYINASASADVEATAQVEKGGTATSYEAPNFTTHTTTFPSAIYRGSEDVVNGTETHDMVVIDFGSLSWTYDAGTNSMIANLPDAKMPVDNDTPMNAVCSISQIIKANDRVTITGIRAYMFYNYPQLYIRDSGYTDATAFTTAMTGQTLAYELSTPTTSPVTPTNLPIKSLSPYTHIESSTGDMEVEYITQDYQPLVDLIESGNGHTYSTSEQIVGKWTNGKDVYEKTIYYATLSCSRSDWSQLEALDAETFISYSATAHMETASGRQIDNNYIRISYYNGYLYHHEPEFGTGMVDLYVTVRYTKPSSNTRSLNLTKSAVTEEIPDEIKNASFEEKPDVNEADDDAPTEVDER